MIWTHIFVNNSSPWSSFIFYTLLVHCFFQYFFFHLGLTGCFTGSFNYKRTTTGASTRAIKSVRHSWSSRSRAGHAWVNARAFWTCLKCFSIILKYTWTVFGFWYNQKHLRWEDGYKLQHFFSLVCRTL